jgi:hypothetical protein
MAKASAFSPGFNEAGFRDAIKNTMLMGVPEKPEERLTWWWQRSETYSPDDPAGDPYDWTQPPVSSTPGNPKLPDKDTTKEQSLVVNYALEFSARPAGSANTVFGEVDTSRAIVSLSDTDYEQIKDAHYATIGNTTYRIQFHGPPVGLFGYTLHQLFLEAEDSA